MITQILDRIYSLLKQGCFEWFCPMSEQDIKILSNREQLRSLKFLMSDSEPFNRSRSLNECADTIRKNGKDYKRLLEFCVLKNRYITEDVGYVFPDVVGDPDE